MIKRGIITLLITFSANIILAQTFGGGVFAGLTASQLDGDQWGGYHKAGMALGIYTNAQINSYVDAQMELKYIQKGSRSDSKEQNIFYVSKLNYVEIPVFLKYHFLGRFNANVGLTAGYLQKATEDKDKIGDEPADPAFNSFELAALAGVEYQISEKFYFNLRFNYSILPVRDHPGDQTYYLNRGQYNNVLTFAVYYQITNFGK